MQHWLFHQTPYMPIYQTLQIPANDPKICALAHGRQDFWLGSTGMCQQMQLTFHFYCKHQKKKGLMFPWCLASTLKSTTKCRTLKINLSSTEDWDWDNHSRWSSRSCKNFPHFWWGWCLGSHWQFKYLILFVWCWKWIINILGDSTVSTGISIATTSS